MVPKTLYRGMRLSMEQLLSYSFTRNVGMPSEFFYNESGMKCVRDGNEYGIYMTDNENMVDSAYGNVSVFDTVDMDHSVRIGMDGKCVGMPMVGVKMEVSTEGLSVKEPYICQEMMGHYNNGFQGKEWISTEDIPLQNLKYTKVVVGPDILHDAKDFSGVAPIDIKQKLVQEMNKRERALSTMIEDLKQVPPGRLMRASNKGLEDSLRLLYGERDAAHRNPTSMPLGTKEDAKAFLLSIRYGEHGLDLKEIKEVDRFLRNVDEDAPLDLLELKSMAEDELSIAKEWLPKKIEAGKREEALADIEGWKSVVKYIERNTDFLRLSTKESEAKGMDEFDDDMER